MPGLTVVAGPGPLAIERGALGLLAHGDDYVTEPYFEGRTLAVVATRYPGYPIACWQDDRFTVVLEGRVYDADPRELESELLVLARALIDEPPPAAALARFAARDGEFVCVLLDRRREVRRHRHRSPRPAAALSAGRRATPDRIARPGIRGARRAAPLDRHRRVPAVRLPARRRHALRRRRARAAGKRRAPPGRGDHPLACGARLRRRRCGHRRRSRGGRSWPRGWSTRATGAPSAGRPSSCR